MHKPEISDRCRMTVRVHPLRPALCCLPRQLGLLQKLFFFFAFFFSHPVHHLRLLSRSFLIVTWIDSRGHTYSRLFSPIPPTVRRTCAPCICYRVKGSALSCLADSRTIAGGGITPVFSTRLPHAIIKSIKSPRGFTQLLANRYFA